MSGRAKCRHDKYLEIFLQRIRLKARNDHASLWKESWYTRRLSPLQVLPLATRRALHICCKLLHLPSSSSKEKQQPDHQPSPPIPPRFYRQAGPGQLNTLSWPARDSLPPMLVEQIAKNEQRRARWGVLLAIVFGGSATRCARYIRKCDKPLAEVAKHRGFDSSSLGFLLAPRTIPREAYLSLSSQFLPWAFFSARIAFSPSRRARKLRSYSDITIDWTDHPWDLPRRRTGVRGL